jgi:tetratricopeptide (TPR) repeat protein
MANLYVIRFKDGKSSTPLSAEEIKKRIHRGELKEDDELSLHPNNFSLRIKDYPEFESSFQVDTEQTILSDLNKKTESLHEERTILFQTPTDLKSAEVDQSQRQSDLTRISNKQAPYDGFDKETQRQATVVFERPKELLRKEEKVVKPEKSKILFGIKIPKKSFLIMVLLAIVAYEIAFEDEPDQKKNVAELVLVPVRPRLPSAGAEKVDPELSVKIYSKGLKPYLEDTVQGYRKAVDLFQSSLKYDPQNVKALAMLASSYLNLADSANKDENTFAVINKLIELSRLKQLDLVETLLAEVEFLSASQRFDAGIQRLVQYSKVSGKFDPILYFYLGWLHTQKGELGNAMKYLNLIPASALPMPKLFYLRGFLHEENQEYDEATAEYKRALALNPKHARSLLGLIRISEKKGELKKSIRYIDFLNNNPSYQSPKEFVRTLIYRSKIALLFQNTDDAVKSLEKAIRIDPKNEDLRLEYYTLLSSSGKESKYKSLAQMYALVLDGERNRKAGKVHEAVSVLLQAQDIFPKSSVPFEKMGDLFYSNQEYERAQANYKKALSVNPEGAEIAIKLIDTLIHNHEWEDAQKYLARYRSHPKLKSSIDRLAGDLEFSRGNFNQSINFYKKAMARDTIDTDVYASYANALKELDQCKDAQFFYSLAQKLDPFSYRSILGAAQCLLKTDGLNQAVSRIQDELAKLPKARADLLNAVAEIYYQSHEDEKALQFTAQAKEIDSDYPDSYRIEGNIYLRMMAGKKELKKKALIALKNYSDRKPSDPYGYIERFRIFLSDSNFEQAAEELNRVFEVSPRYPELHYFRAKMYSKMGRDKDALSELEQELKLNPRFVKALIDQGNIYIRANNIDEAQKNFVKAMEIDPMSAEGKLGAGYINYLKRQFSSAIALYQSALSIDKGNPEIYKRLGAAYRDSGDGAKAAAAFQSYLDLAPDAPDKAEYEQYKK